MDRFWWGVATSAFQIEGFVENDMTVWERRSKFNNDGKHPLYQNGSAHWLNWRGDFELLKQLNVNAYRFSMEWARIEPQCGTFDGQALDQYEQMVDRLLELNIEPFLTLHHFTHPVWFHEKTPWTSEQAQDVFCRFTEVILKRFADRISYWITFNEPLVWALAAYGDGKFPPGRSDGKLMMRALVNILKAHQRAYSLIKSYRPQAKIGMAKHFITFEAHRKWFAADRSLADLLHHFFNKMIPEAFETNRLQFHFPLLFDVDEAINLKNRIDFWGVNYYYRMFVAFRLNIRRPFQFIFKDESGLGLTDMGWEVYPDGLSKVLRYMGKFNKDIIITENGIATLDESLRMRFIDAHLEQVLKARENGLPVKGYFYWSFLDNYEWLEGKNKRFGLVHVDYENDFRRTVKQSARHYARIIQIDLNNRKGSLS
ncbi:glycoside hydrolase family 1 protein [Calditrichota bacterium LG25]